MCRILITSAVAFLLSLSVFANRIGDARDQDTIVIVNEPITIQGTLLQPGEYLFSLMVWTANRNVVRIFDQNRHLVTTKMTWPIFRLGNSNQSQFTFYESSAQTLRGPEQPPALRTWFSPGYQYGFRFAEK
jgi:hypothetical protein